MDNLQFDEELSKLIENCQLVIRMHDLILKLDDFPEVQEKFTEELSNLIIQFHKQCFKLLPAVKRKAQIEPEYRDLLEQLKVSVRLLSDFNSVTADSAS